MVYLVNYLKKENLIETCHDVSLGGILTAISKMSVKGNRGIKLFSIAGLVNKFEYFFGEDQGRYLIELSKNNLKNIETLFKKNNVFHEIVAEVQNDTFEIEGLFSLKTKDLQICNNKWYKDFNAIN